MEFSKAPQCGAVGDYFFPPPPDEVVMKPEAHHIVIFHCSFQCLTAQQSEVYLDILAEL